MSYTSANHETFSRRVRNLVLQLQEIRDEGSRLDAIYTNEAQSGGASEWGDSNIATAAEHVAVINLIRDLEDFFTNTAVAAGDRQANLTPFLQDVQA